MKTADLNQRRKKQVCNPPKKGRSSGQADLSKKKAEGKMRYLEG